MDLLNNKSALEATLKDLLTKDPSLEPAQLLDKILSENSKSDSSEVSEISDSSDLRKKMKPIIKRLRTQIMFSLAISKDSSSNQENSNDKLVTPMKNNYIKSNRSNVNQDTPGPSKADKLDQKMVTVEGPIAFETYHNHDLEEDLEEAQSQDKLRLLNDPCLKYRRVWFPKGQKSEKDKDSESGNTNDSESDSTWEVRNLSDSNPMTRSIHALRLITRGEVLLKEEALIHSIDTNTVNMQGIKMADQIKFQTEFFDNMGEAEKLIEMCVENREYLDFRDVQGRWRGGCWKRTMEYRKKSNETDTEDNSENKKLAITNPSESDEVINKDQDAAASKSVTSDIVPSKISESETIETLESLLSKSKSDVDPKTISDYKSRLEIAFQSIFLSNSFPIEEILQGNAANNNDDNAPDFKETLALFPTLSRFNHSCSPNAVLITQSQSHIDSNLKPLAFIFALRQIEVDEEITIAYTPSVLLAPFKERWQMLHQQFGFPNQGMCFCKACVNLKTQIQNKNMNKKSKIPDNESDLNQQLKTILTSVDFKRRMQIGDKNRSQARVMGLEIENMMEDIENQNQENHNETESDLHQDEILKKQEDLLKMLHQESSLHPDLLIGLGQEAFAICLQKIWHLDQIQNDNQTKSDSYKNRARYWAKFVSENARISSEFITDLADRYDKYWINGDGGCRLPKNLKEYQKDTQRGF